MCASEFFVWQEFLHLCAYTIYIHKVKVYINGLAINLSKLQFSRSVYYQI